MRLRSSLDLELRPLLKALKKRMEDLSDVSRDKKNGWEVYTRKDVEFMHLETKRDHMNLDLWLPADEIHDARSSGIAKPHPFDEGEAIRVCFERAEDLTTVARWVEKAHAHALGKKTGSKKATSKKATAKTPARKPRRIARSTSSPLANGVSATKSADAKTATAETTASAPTSRPRA